MLAELPGGYPTLSGTQRRRALAGWAIMQVTGHRAEAAASRIGAEIDRVSAALRREQTQAEEQQAPLPTGRAVVVFRTVYSVSPYVVPCATGCGHWLPAAGPRPVVARSNLCDRLRGQARRAARCARRLERAA